MKSNATRPISARSMTIWLIILFKFIVLSTCVLSDEIQLSKFNSLDFRSESDRHPKRSLNRPLYISSIDNTFDLLRSVQTDTPKASYRSSSYESSHNLLSRIKRENHQLLINSELANGHDSLNTFQPSNGESYFYFIFFISKNILYDRIVYYHIIRSVLLEP